MVPLYNFFPVVTLIQFWILGKNVFCYDNKLPLIFILSYLDMSSATNNECNDPSIPIPKPTRNLPNIKRKDIFPNAKQIQPIKIGRHDIKVVAFLPMYSQIRAVQVILGQKLSFFPSIHPKYDSRKYLSSACWEHTLFKIRGSNSHSGRSKCFCSFSFCF